MVHLGVQWKLMVKRSENLLIVGQGDGGGAGRTFIIGLSGSFICLNKVRFMPVSLYL